MALIKRSQTPPKFPNYRSYKQYLRKDFDYRCVYCNIREAEDGGSGKFHIDHYQPQKRFPQKSNEYSNLFYSCNDCNRFKSGFWPNFLQRIQGKFILNPCDHDFDIHYNRVNPAWEAIGKTADWNIERLRLNSPKRIQIRKDRKYLLECIDKLELQKTKLLNLLETVTASDNRTKADILQRIINTQEKIDVYRRKTVLPLD